MLIGKAPRTTPEDLVGLLLECHGRIRSFTHLAVEIGRRGDAPPADVADACARCERYFVEALPLHVEDEEASILPRVRGRHPDVDAVLATMCAQHEEHRPQLAALLDALRALRAMPAGRVERDRVLAAAEPLAADFERHLALEEEHLFPAVRAVVSEEEQRAAVEELRARRRPRTLR